MQLCAVHLLLAAVFLSLGLKKSTALVSAFRGYYSCAEASCQRGAQRCGTSGSKVPTLRSSSTDLADNVWDLTLVSPCKLNLFLRVVGRRPNGFHDLASLFQTISLSDTLKFRKLSTDATCDELVCSDPNLEVTADNLVIRALELMRKRTKLNQYFSVYLDKKVPMQAGLGGGSGNAATAMHAFNTLCGYRATQENLLEWSGEIGSDISFFFSSGTAYCTGRGEIVHSLLPLPEAQHTIVHIFKMKEGLSTAAVFKSLDLSKCSTVIPESLLDCFTGKGPLVASRDGRLINDLEAPAFYNLPILSQLKRDLEREYEPAVFTGVMMSGSGTSIYALSDKRTAKSVDFEPILRKYDGLSLFQCELVNRTDEVCSWYQ